ncbi:MAG: hypothetical protein GX962_02290 [Epulopiscium sp.]|nr:hypothetical protein [Candidatus Epulonipiscium sp.]
MFNVIKGSEQSLVIERRSRMDIVRHKAEGDLLGQHIDIYIATKGYKL